MSNISWKDYPPDCVRPLASTDESENSVGVDYRILTHAKEIYSAMKDLLMSHQGDRKYRDQARDLIQRIEGEK